MDEFVSVGKKICTDTDGDGENDIFLTGFQGKKHFFTDFPWIYNHGGRHFNADETRIILDTAEAAGERLPATRAAPTGLLREPLPPSMARSTMAYESSGSVLRPHITCSVGAAGAVAFALMVCAGTLLGGPEVINVEMRHQLGRTRSASEIVNAG